MKKKWYVVWILTISLLFCTERFQDYDVANSLTNIEDIGLSDTDNALALSLNLRYVDLFIGTGGYPPWGVGNNLPGAATPFGMVKVSPDTQSEKDYTFQNHCAGYFYNDEYISGFSNVHFSGTGVPDYGNLRVLPIFFSDRIDGRTESYRSLYKKETEYAEAGYYRVELESGIRAELTATERVAFHRYTYKQGNGMRCILFDIGKTLPLSVVTESEMSINQKTGEIRAYAHQNGGLSINYGGYDIYFYGQLTPPPEKLYGWENDENLREDRARCKDGGMCGLIACYKNTDKTELKIAVSYTSFDGAKMNFFSEGRDISFDEARQRNQLLWDRIFRRINVSGGTESERKVFYSALYHIFMMPTLQSDVDGSYRGFDKANHKAEWGNYYSDFSLWDTYRTLHPFLALFFPEYQRDMQYSLLQMAREGGYFPKWPLAGGETNCMIGSPAEIVIADGFLKGIEMPYEEAYTYILKTALNPVPKGLGYNGRDGIEDYLKFGFVTADEKGSVSKTMELSFADNALCNMATDMNKSEAEIFCKNRYNYRNHFSEKTGYFLPKKSNGEFVGEDTFDPDNLNYDVLHPDNDDFIEGTAHHYRWFAFYDIDFLIEKDGGKEAFVKRLSDLFEKSIKEEQYMRENILLRGQSRRYLWMGNEPDIHYVFLFSLAKRPDLTCRYLNWIRDTYFTATPDGLPGNDDGGTLSAWYVFSALGFYPIAGTNEYIAGCPLFDRVEIILENGKYVEVIKEGDKTKDAYPAEIYVNNVRVDGTKIHFDEIKNGAKIRFVMKRL
ncbi:MAG: GH92 family glycosyl hydrolase [Deltaproteobacteria bacterium]|nr:GH92 family glycosyl hydrolase [Deltaproteobacteria bacterium]